MIRSTVLPMIFQAAILTALGGCAVVGKPETPTTMRLSPSFAEPASARAATSLSVAAVQARGLTADRRYIYVDRAAPAELRQAATLFWEEPQPRAF